MAQPLRQHLIAALVVLAGILCILRSAPADAPTPVDLQALVERQAAKPSVHGEPHELDAALAAAGLPADEIRRLWLDVAATTVPGIGGRLDAFLFLTRDPAWLRVRGAFAEFLNLPQLQTLSAADVAPLVGFDGVISLPGIATLDVDAAGAFDSFGAMAWGAAVEFPGLAEIPPDVAAALARCDGLLVFPHLRTLSLESARALAGHEGMGIVLGGLRSLPADVAAALAECRSRRGLMLPDLEVLDSLPLVRRLVRQDSVFLPRVATLTPEVAAQLHGVDGSGELSLPGLAALPPEVARPLAEPGFYSITLGCAATLGPEAAAALAGHPGPLTFNGTTAFPASAARELARRDADILLPHVAALPADVTAALAPHEGGLVLGGVTTLSVPQARALAAHAGPIFLESLETLEPAAAAALADRDGELVIPALTVPDADTARALADFRGDVLELPAVADLTPQVAARLAEHRGTLSLPGVTALSAEAAGALARQRGELLLDGLTELAVDVAAALALHDGGGLTLRGLVNLPEAAAAALAAHRGDLALDGIPILSTATAAALAGCPGRLSLLGLAEIEPRALALLLARQRVDMPPVQELSLTIEPGRGNDDFAVPNP